MLHLRYLAEMTRFNGYLYILKCMDFLCSIIFFDVVVTGHCYCWLIHFMTSAAGFLTSLLQSLSQWQKGQIKCRLASLKNCFPICMLCIFGMAQRRSHVQLETHHIWCTQKTSEQQSNGFCSTRFSSTDVMVSWETQQPPFLFITFLVTFMLLCCETWLLTKHC